MALPDNLTNALDDLQDLQPERSGPPRRTAAPRLKTLGAAVRLWDQVVRDDDENARKRAKIDRMFDGAPPYDPDKLKAMGQGGRCNINFGEAQRHFDAAQAGYVDLVMSPEFLVDVKSATSGGEILQDEADAILNEELTGAIRDWPEFEARFLQLTSQFIRHGVGAAYFPDTTDWRFRVAGLKDFKVPRRARACEEALDIAFAREDYAVHELYEAIENESVAEAEGWNPSAVKQALLRAHRGDKNDRHTNWEGYQEMVKNGDTFSATGVKSIRILHMWVKEMDGKVSHYIWEESQANKKAAPSTGETQYEGDRGDFLFRDERAVDRAEQAYTIFTYGVGNGTYHSIRGYGQRIFAAIQYLNRLQCQTADAAAIAGGVMIQPNSMEDLRDVALQFFGPYTVLRPNMDIVDRRAVPDLSRNMLPVINDLRYQLQEASDFQSTSKAAQGSPYRNTLQVRAELEASTRLSAASLALFYSSFDRLMREVVRRLIGGPMSDPTIKEFYRRCEARGLTREQIKSVDHRRTRAARTIGAGNPAARIAALDELDRERGFYDEGGNRNLTFDRTAARVGHDIAKRYVRRPQQPRGSTDQTDAALENSLMELGVAPPVLPAQLHGNHLEMHLPVANQLIEAITTQQIDPVQALPRIAAIHSQLAAHAQALAADPTQQDMVRLTLNVSNKLRQILENTERQAQAEQTDSAPAETDPKAQAMLETSRVRQQIMQEEAAVRLRIEEEKARQKQRLEDMKAAAEVVRSQQAEAVAALAEPFRG